MSKKLFVSLGLLTLLLGSCSREQATEPRDRASASSSELSAGGARSATLLSSDAVHRGVLHVRLSREAVRQLRLEPSSGAVAMQSLPSTLLQTLRSAGTTELEPLFPIDPRFEARMRREGLDQWYIVRTDVQAELTSVVEALRRSDEIEWIEPSYVITTSRVEVTPLPETSKRLLNEGAMPYDDERLPEQWHYDNPGTLPSSARGADINLFEAWRHETGRPSVIVSVVDGGIDFNHPDLRDNMWRNEGEIADNRRDDDGNGFVDDIHGWNFSTNRKDIVPDAISHGTHVAGTVGARTNNGIGVAGVAGGNGQPGTGVRLMSCQTFAGAVSSVPMSDRSTESRYLMSRPDPAVRAIVYGANNGAVISQNSWGYRFPGLPEIPADVKAAIDYFIKYAGCDNEGNQLPESPMKGGVVIFAAGNDDTDYLCFPAAYQPTIAVSAMSPSWLRADYTNRGAWVDIMAPGGDANFGGSAGQVLSTLSHERYGFMQGTSMACPHVSGIAALIISHYGGPGFTNERLEGLLLSSLRPQDINEHNSKEQGRLGIGYIDAGKAFAVDGKKAPERISAIEMKTISWTSAFVGWQAVRDADDGTAASYRIYTSLTPITDASLKTLDYSRVSGVGVVVGGEMTHSITGLKDDTDYYVGLVGIDRWGNASPVAVKTFRTKKNHAPILTLNHEGAIKVSVRQRAKLTVSIQDPDEHLTSVKLSGEERGVSHTVGKGVINISIAAIAPIGKHQIELSVRDEYGAETQLVIPFEVYKYVEPAFNAHADLLAQQVVGVGQTQTIDLNTLISKSEGVEMRYTVSSGDETILTAQVNESGILTLGGVRKGKAMLRVLASDGIGQSISRSFDLRVVDNTNDIIYSLYPIPATKQINAALNPSLDALVVEIRSTSGRVLMRREYAKGTAQIALDIRGLTPGSYTLRASSAGRSSTRTFVKL